MYKPWWVTFRATNDQHNRIALVAALYGCTVSDVIRKSLRDVGILERDIARKANMLGVDLTSGIDGVLNRADQADEDEIRHNRKYEKISREDPRWDQAAKNIRSIREAQYDRAWLSLQLDDKASPLSIYNWHSSHKT